MPEAAIQRHMPRRRSGHTTSVAIGGERFYLTANGDDDGSLGEVFIQWGKQGSTGAGLMDVYAVALSVGLQQAIDWLPYPDRASLGVLTIDERMAASDRSHIRDRRSVFFVSNSSLVKMP